MLSRSAVLRPLLRRLAHPSSTSFISSAHVRVLSTEEMEHLLKNPFFSKYAEKLKHLQETDPDSFKAKLAELEKAYQKMQPEEKEEQPAQSSSQNDQTKEKTLDSILKLDLIKDKSAEEIEKIWNEYHKTKDCVFAVIPAQEYEAMEKHSKEYPRFLYPLPRGDGYEFFYQQFSGSSCHFTPLIAYQAHGENSPPCLTLEHYTDILEDKGIVLMRGQPDTKLLSPYEAQLLALQTKMYYGQQSGLKFNFVRIFNNDPTQFEHMDLIREFENYKKDYRQHKEDRK